MECNVTFSFVCYEFSCFQQCMLFPYITDFILLICIAYLTLKNFAKLHTRFSFASVQPRFIFNNLLNTACKSAQNVYRHA